MVLGCMSKRTREKKNIEDLFQKENAWISFSVYSIQEVKILKRFLDKNENPSVMFQR
jgi:hypothetical protein